MMDDAEGKGAKGTKERMSEGIRQGIGVLSAFKDALEETIQEARDRGDLSADRARMVMKRAMETAQASAEDARERFDFVSRVEFDSLRAEVAALRKEVDGLRREVSGPHDPEQPDD